MNKMIPPTDLFHNRNSEVIGTNAVEISLHGPKLIFVACEMLSFHPYHSGNVPTA